VKVLNLRCAHGHAFEGWFDSEDDFLDQNGRGLIECPVCGDHGVTRMPSAPRLNLSGAKAPAGESKPHGPAPAGGLPAGASPPPPPSAVPAAPAGGAAPPALQVAWLHAVRELVARTEDVGERFAEEARRIHYGEAPGRAIRGRTTPEERAALDDEGIEVVSIPMPRALQGPVQ
jgi:hypothetical protein